MGAIIERQAARILIQVKPNRGIRAICRECSPYVAREDFG